MRLLQHRDEGSFQLTENLRGNAVPPYTILSHTWGNDEVTFEDLTTGSSNGKAGYDKLHFCSAQTARDGFRYFWVDSCCIKKSSDSELTESLNSMFRWYQLAEKCYVYLSDVSAKKRRASDENSHGVWEQAFRDSRWFKRGWTLQELLAPGVVEFFSREGTRIGDKRSLEQQIYEVTGIPTLALRGGSLSRFSTEQKFAWAANRDTAREEDQAYCLLGIFSLSMPVIYGEGRANAMRRLRKEIEQSSQSNECLQHLYVTNPRADKIRIEDTKGGLIPHSYQWLLVHDAFRKWRDDAEATLLWIRGDPGKGKTMLLCGVIDTLSESTSETHNLSFFFCQATDTRINNSNAVLRGLLWCLAKQQPALATHIQKPFEHANNCVFEDANAWSILAEILSDILRDPDLKPTYLIVDALDECVHGLPKLLKLIVQSSPLTPRVKWIVSSRNWPQIGEQLDQAQRQVTLRLELSAASISAAVRSYIDVKVDELSRQKGYNDQTKNTVLDYLTTNAHDTFLWVALVCNNLRNIPRWKVLSKLTLFPPGLEFLYGQMMEQICESEDADLCLQILAIISTVYRPMTLRELSPCIRTNEDLSDDLECLHEIISLCGSFLVTKKDTVYFVHQSAKDYLLREMKHRIFPCGMGSVHHQLFLNMMESMAMVLKRDIYGLDHIGYPIDQVEAPHPDPLADVIYSCNYWVEHLCAWIADSQDQDTDSVDSRTSSVLDTFLRTRFLFWLEALSLYRTLHVGLPLFNKLHELLKCQVRMTGVSGLVEDARRFMMQGKAVIEAAPLQVYGSALIFSPAESLIRRCFEEEQPSWIQISPVSTMRGTWSDCLLTLEGHQAPINQITFSPNKARVASLDLLGIIKIWDPTSGTCFSTITSDESTNAIAFVHGSDGLMSISSLGAVQVWDADTGEPLEAIGRCNASFGRLAISSDSKIATSSASVNLVKVWDINLDKVLYTHEGRDEEGDPPLSSRNPAGWRWMKLGVDQLHPTRPPIAICHKSTFLATGMEGDAVSVLDVRTGEQIWLLEGHGDSIAAVAFSHDSKLLASAARNGVNKIWDLTTGRYVRSFDCANDHVYAMFFSSDSELLMTFGSRMIRLWSVADGNCLYSKEATSPRKLCAGPSQDLRNFALSWPGELMIWTVVYHPQPHFVLREKRMDGAVVLSADLTKITRRESVKNIEIRDMDDQSPGQYLEHEGLRPRPLAFSFDSGLLATECEGALYTWCTSSGKLLMKLDGRLGVHSSAVFSPNSTLLAATTTDDNVKIWDLSGGCLLTINDISETLASIAFSQDSTMLITSSYTSAVKLWASNSSNSTQEFSGFYGVVISLAFAHNSPWLATVSSDSTIRLLNTETGEIKHLMKPKTMLTTSPAYSRDVTRIALAGPDSLGSCSTITVWDSFNGRCLLRHSYDSGIPVDAMAFSPNRTQLAVSWNGNLEVYKISEEHHRRVLQGHTDGIRCLAFLQSAQLLLSGSYDGTISLWDLSEQTVAQKEDSGGSLIRCVAISHDSLRIVAGCNNGRIEVWDMIRGARLQPIVGHTNFVTSVMFMGSSDRILTASGDRTIKCFDISNGYCVLTLEGHLDTVSSVSLSFDHVHLASGSVDKTARIWDLNGSKVLTLRGHERAIGSVAFSCDASYLATGSYDSTIRVWDTLEGACLSVLSVPSPEMIASVSLPPASRKYLASASIGGRIRLWDLTHNTCLRTFDILRTFRLFSFGASENHLNTDHGILNIDAQPQGDSASCAPKFTGLGVSYKRDWILFNSKPVLWLPLECRPVGDLPAVAISGNTISVGTADGKLWIFKFDVISAERGGYI